MTLISKEAREWAERIVSRHDVNNWPEKYQDRAAWDHEVRRAGLVADDLLAALKAMVLNDTHTYRDCHKAALAAIAKAEGRT